MHFKKFLLIAIALLALTATASAATCPFIKQFGITWTFAEPFPECGTYANGDNWVVGPVNITGINPPTAVVNSPKELGGTFDNRVINCGVINPIPSNLQGYDSAANAWIDEYCVTRNISAGSPLYIDVSEIPVKSLVSTISTNIVPNKNSTPRLQTAAILTVVASTPSADAFRPPYSGNYKPAEIRKADIDWGALQKLPIPQATPSLSSSEQDFERPWLVHKGPYPGSVINAVQNGPGYGREQSRESGIAALLLNLNYSRAQKEPLLFNFLQYGIDVYGITSTKESIADSKYTPQRIWYGAGAIGIGKRTSLIFAAKVLNHSGMIGILQKQGDYLWEKTNENGYPAPYGPGNRVGDFSKFPPDYIQFGEEQVFYVTQNHVDAMTDGRWVPDDRGGTPIPYTSNDLGLPEWGERVAENAGDCDKSWNAIYRMVSGGGQVGSVLALHLMGAEEITNHDAWFDYFDRYIQKIAPYTLEKPWRFGSNGVDLYASSPFVWNMWNGYRNDYGCIYTGLVNNERQYDCSQCKYNCVGVCTNGETKQCGTSNVGECSYGIQTCSNESWGTCIGAVNPVTESLASLNCSDGKDNDCDGVSDGQDSSCDEVIVPDALVAYWRFENNLQDEIGNNDGSFQGGTESYVEGKVGQALEFDGVDDFVNINNAAAFASLSEGTISAWVFVDGVSATGPIFSVTNAASTNYARLALDTGPKLSWAVRASGTWPVRGSTDIALNQWHHVAIAVDGTGNRVYINGIQQTIAYNDGGPSSTEFLSSSPNSNTAQIGKLDLTGTQWDRFFNGTIDEVRIYNRALSQAEILALYNETGQGCVDITALLGHISQWKQGNLRMASLMQKLELWKAGTGC